MKFTASASLCFLIVSLLFSFTNATLRPQIPVIGILSTPSDYPEEYEPETYSFIRETYPNYIRKAGGYPLFIPYNLSDAELFPLLEGIHALLLIGGDTKLWKIDEETQRREFTPYVRQVQKVISYIQRENNDTTYMPLMGICEGMEVILLGLTNDPYLLDNFDNRDTHASVLVTQEGRESKMFQGMAVNQLEYLEDSGTLFYNHEFGYNLSSLNKYEDLQKSLRMTAIAQDKNSDVFIAAMEAKDWPLYLVMFHPERIGWENEAARYAHHEHVTYFSDSLAEFFVKEAAKNKRKLGLVNDWEKWDFNRFEAIFVQDDRPKAYVAKNEQILNFKN